MCEGLYEWEELICLVLLSVVVGESIFLFGFFGVGKSLVVCCFKYVFKDGVFFEYLMSKFSILDEVFGLVFIKKLKDEDKYECLIEGYFL